MTWDGIIVIGAAGGLGRKVIPLLVPHVNIMLPLDRIGQPEIQYLDLADWESVERLLAAIPISRSSKWGMVIASGVYDGGDLPNRSPSYLEHSLAVNLLRPVQLAVGFAERLVSLSGIGRIVVVTSAAAYVGSRDIAYGTSKAGLIGCVRSLSKVYANGGVSCLGVAPGLFPSPMSAGQSVPRSSAGRAAEHLSRGTLLEEVASATAYALLEAPESMTGSIIQISAGAIG
jgi:NAD(P)-dependent dehydrogenase (short-subunit alcohol dehydrogenase family)